MLVMGENLIELSKNEKLDWLRLIRSENVGPITFYQLLERFGTAEAALKALPDLAAKGGRAGRLKIAPRKAAEEELAQVEARGARMVARSEPDYPPLLRHVEDAPPLITLLGHGHLATKKAVALVGARNASANGRRFARELASALGQSGLLVVSGLARGIDAAAHEGGLATGTLGVVAGGVDVRYPKENTRLYESMEAQGCILAESPLGTTPQARHFPRRNRLISGICRGVVVVEASPKSGSLITARLALEQNREVFAVPGAPGDPRTQGCNALIREGAHLTEGVDDVLAILAEAFRKPLSEPPGLFHPSAERPDMDESEIAQARSLVGEQLSYAPTAIDDLIRETGLGAAAVQVVLLELELAGRLERQPGNKVAALDK